MKINLDPIAFRHQPTDRLLKGAIRTTALALGISTLAFSTAGQANGFDAGRHLLGDWGGTRAELAENGVNIRLGYFNQTAYNAEGGQDSTTAYADQIFLGGYFDFEKLFGWKGADFKIEITNRNGELINQSAEIPFLLQSQQIFGRGNVTRLTQFSLTQKLFDDHLSLKVGRIYPSADFFSLSCAFQHLTFCSGGSSNYISSNWYGDPLSALGGQVTFTPDNHWYFKIGSYDANPRNTSTDQGLRLTTPGDEGGTLLVSEIQYVADYGNGLDGNYRAGITRSSVDKTAIVNQAGLPTGLSDDPATIEDSDSAFFINLEQQITSNDAGGGLRLFASLIRPDDKVSSVGEVMAIGGFITGPFESRPKDRMGLAFGRNSVSSDLTDAQRRYNAIDGNVAIDVQEYEYPIEFNYNFVLTPAIEIMPSIQYILSPGGDEEEDDALILGMQFSLNF